MKAMLTNKKAGMWLSLASVCVLIMGLAACTPSNQTKDESTDSKEPATQVQMPAPNENGIITAEAWKDIYPDEYATYMENNDNTDPGDYTEIYPQIKTIWAGSAFSKYYNEPNGHTYALKDISETGRNPKTANCLTCKSSEFILKQDADPTLNTSDIHEMEAQVSEPISCYDCHENTPKDGTVAIRQFFVNAVGDDASQLPEGAMSCGQCHNEYFFPGENKAAENPWSGLAEATPEKVLAIENGLTGGKRYVDHTNPDNGTEQIKVQHPEFETVYGGEGSPMAKQGYSCSDCHMADAKSESGTEYKSHNWTSPLENEELIANDCSKCHKDIKAEVKANQTKAIDRVNSIGDKLVDLNNKLAAVVADGSKSDDELNALRELNRTSQFYWDWVMVENSDGAHNSALAQDTLDKSEAAVDEALAQL